MNASRGFITLLPVLVTMRLIAKQINKHTLAVECVCVLANVWLCIGSAHGKEEKNIHEILKKSKNKKKKYKFDE